jgi:hypothetical protein
MFGPNDNMTLKTFYLGYTIDAAAETRRKVATSRAKAAPGDHKPVFGRVLAAEEDAVRTLVVV